MPAAGTRFRNKETNTVVTLYGDSVPKALQSGNYEPVDDTVSVPGGTLPAASATATNIVETGANLAPAIAEGAEAYEASKYNSFEHKSEALGMGIGSAFVVPSILASDETKKSVEHNKGYYAAGAIGANVTLGIGAGGAAAKGAAALGAKSPLAKAAVAGAIETAPMGMTQQVSDMFIEDKPFTAESIVNDIILKAGVGSALFGAASGAFFHGLGKLATGKTTGRAIDNVVDDVSAPKLEIDDAKVAASEGKPKPQVPETTAAPVYNKETFKSVSTNLKSLEDLTLTGAKQASLPTAPNNFIGSQRLSRQLVEETEGLLDPKIAAPLLRKYNKAGEQLDEMFGNTGLFERNSSLDAGGHQLVVDILSESPANAQKAAKLLVARREAADALNEAAGLGGMATQKGIRQDPHDFIKAIAEGKAPSRDLAVFEEAIDAADESSRALSKSWKVKPGKKGTPESLADDAFERFLELPPKKAEIAARDMNDYIDRLEDVIRVVDDPTLSRSAQETLDSLRANFKRLPEMQSGTAEDILAGIGAPVDAPLGQTGDDVMKLYLQNKTATGELVDNSGVSREMIDRYHNQITPKPKASKDGSVVNSALNVANVAGSVAYGNWVGAAYGVAGLMQSSGRTKGFLSTLVQKAASGAYKTRRVLPATAVTVLNGVSFGDEPPKKESKRKAFESRSKELLALAGNPQALSDKAYEATTDIRGANLTVGDEAQHVLENILNYLVSELPKDPGTLMSMGKSVWQPTDEQVSRFAASMHGAMQPLEVFETALSGGQVMVQEAQAIRAVWPSMFQEYQQAIAGNLDTLQQTLNRSQRTNLSLLFGVPVDPSMEPENLKFFQELAASRKEENQPVKIQGGSKPEPTTPAQSMQGR